MNLKEKIELRKERFIKLTESETGKSEVSSAIRKIGSEIQQMAKKLSGYKTEELQQIINKTKLEFGSSEADNLKQSATSAIDELINLLLETSQNFYDSSYLMNGDAASNKDIVADIEDDLKDEEENEEENKEVEEDEEAEEIDLDASVDSRKTK